jgi:probable addiction module antidote protein
MRTKKLRRHEDALIEELRDHDEAAAYLSAALDENDLETFLLALKRVAQAQGISKVAMNTDVNRQHIYRALSEGGNPTLKNLMAIGLEVKTKKKAVGE